MEKDKTQPTIVRKEMGITHEEFNGKLPELLNEIPYRRIKDTIKFQLNQKHVEIILEPEAFRELSRSVRLPVTVVTIHFHDFSEEEASNFIKHFNLRFMKGGG
jgi:hypothetical protein